jgi:hypothetical protein
MLKKENRISVFDIQERTPYCLTTIFDKLPFLFHRVTPLKNNRLEFSHIQ